MSDISDFLKNMSGNSTSIEFSSEEFIKTLKTSAIEELLSKIHSYEYLEHLLSTINNILINMNKKIFKDKGCELLTPITEFIIKNDFKCDYISNCCHKKLQIKLCSFLKKPTGANKCNACMSKERMNNSNNDLGVPNTVYTELVGVIVEDPKIGRKSLYRELTKILHDINNPPKRSSSRSVVESLKNFILK